MSLAAAYRREEVVWEQPAARDAYGTPTGSATETTVQARVEWRTQWVRNRAGEQVVARGHILVAAEPAYGDHFTVQGDRCAVLAIERVQAFRTDHYKVFLA